MSTITEGRSRLPAGVDPRRPPRRRPTMRRALLLLVLSLFFPGSAQLAVGNKRIGWTVLTVYLACLASLGGLYVAGGRGEFLSLSVRPRVLLGLVVALAIAGVVWLSVILDAWRLGRPRQLKPRQRVWQAGLAALLCVVVAAPFAYAGRLAAVQHGFITTVFPSGDDSGGGSAGSGNVAQTGRLNILLVGGDSGKNRTGLRPDSTNVVSVDLATGNAVIFGIPRNLEKFPFPKGSAAAKQFPNGFQPVTVNQDNSDNLWESLYGYGQDHPQLFQRKSALREKPGMTAVREAAEATLGLTIHHFVIINLQGFDDLVNALGGVTVRVKHRVPIGGIASFGKYIPPKGYIKPGLRHLNGYKALWYARSRSDTNDFVRMGRQRCLMGALLNQADPFTVIKNYPDIARASESLFDTNLPQNDLPPLARVADKAASAHIRQLGFVPPLIDVRHPDIALIHRKVEEAIKSSESSPHQAKTPAKHASPPSSGSKSGADVEGGTTEGAIKGHSLTLGATCSYH